MSITKAFTFQAGTKARANEVNKNFDDLYSQVNINIADIAQNARDIDMLDANKASINGSSAQRFAVADPVNPTESVNKQTLNKSLTNIFDYINGLTIEKDSASPNDTILVNPGSCYDSNKTVVLELNNITSKKNEGQGASTTYYVYIVGNETGSSIDIIISNSSVEPTLPTGYTKFRNIGRFTTGSDNKIKDINNYSNTFSNSKSEILNWSMPDYSKGIVVNEPYTFTAPNNGVYVALTALNEGRSNLFINGIQTPFVTYDLSTGLSYNNIFVPLTKGDVIYWSAGLNYHEGKFYPYKGAN